MASVPKNVLTFESPNLAPDTLLITHLRGTERLTRPFHFDLRLCSTDRQLDPGALLDGRASVGIKQGVSLASGGQGLITRAYHGILETFELLGEDADWAHYRAVLVPAWWELSRNHRNRIYQDVNIEDLVNAVLGNHEGTAVTAEFDLQGSYPTREYVVQYEETDLDFLHRWLEHEGVFYFFKQEDEEEKIVFADHTGAYQDLPGSPVLEYDPTDDAGDDQPHGVPVTEDWAQEWFKPEVIRAIEMRRGRVPKEVVLNDYNWRDPQTSLQTRADVSATGTGVQYEYNDHFKTQAEGDTLAQVRAEELLAREITYHGRGTCRAFHAGSHFELDGHFRNDFCRDYLATEVTHEAVQTISLSGGQTVSAGYINRFQAMPGDRLFRPARDTEWPSIKGFMHARIDSDQDDGLAVPKEGGAYRVKVPFDLDDPGDGRASRLVRMAQPYAGKNEGFHFPLHKGTEVLLTHLDGDPDRPVIVGTIPNPDTPSPVSQDNLTENIIRSSTGNVLQMSDDKDGDVGIMLANAARTVVHVFTRRQSGGQDNQPSVKKQLDDFLAGKEVSGGDASTARDGIGEVYSGNATDDVSSFSGSVGSLSVTVGPKIIVHVGGSYSGYNNRTTTDEVAINSGKITVTQSYPEKFVDDNGSTTHITDSGNFTEQINNFTKNTTTDNGDTESTHNGNSKSTQMGDSTSTQIGDSTGTQIGDSTGMQIGNSTSLTVGDSTSLCVGNSTSTTIANDVGMTVGNTASTFIGVSSSMFIGASVSAHIGASMSAFIGAKVEAAMSASLEAKLAAALTLTVAASIDICAAAKIEISGGPKLELDLAGEVQLSLTQSEISTLKTMV